MNVDRILHAFNSAEADYILTEEKERKHKRVEVLKKALGQP